MSAPPVRTERIARRRWHWWVSLVAVALFGFLLSQDALARIAWRQYRKPDAALLLVRRNAELAMQLGGYYFGGGTYDLEKAERAYQRALDIKPGILWGHYQLARIHFVRGDFNAAIDEVNRELEANPENLRSLYVRGLIYGYRNLPGDLERAEGDFRRFTRWAPKEWAGYNDLAWVLSKRGKYQEAKAVLRDAFREVPAARENPWLWNSLGVAQLNLGEHTNAAVSLQKAKGVAEELTAEDWRHSYPGNNPAEAASGLQAFREAIGENLRRSGSVDKSP